MELSLFKTIISAVAGLGATTITTQIIKNNVMPGSPIQKITIPVATLVIGSMAGGAVGSYTSTSIDEIAESIKEAKEKFNPLP